MNTSSPKPKTIKSEMIKSETIGSARLSTLDNGVRVLSDSVPSMHTVALGIWINGGTRHEDPTYNGAAHMVEHMLFKGTEKRTAHEIAQHIENVGGAMNAYTSREMTCYYVHLLKDDANLALDVLSDMVLNSTLTEQEIEREREVILQEIGMVMDTPDDLVFDNFYETAWQNQMFGAPILGTSEIIKSMPRKGLKGFIDTIYTAGNIVVSAAGNIDHDALVDQARKIFGHLPPTPANDKNPVTYTGGNMRTNKELEQSHIVLGFKAPSRNDDAYMASRILSSVLGGGMSSRLFQEVREKRGLVYSVYAFTSSYSDAGTFSMYAGTGPDKLTELMPVLCDEARKIEHDLTIEELNRAKAQLKASILRGRESLMRRVDSLAKHYLGSGKLINPDAVIAEIDALNINDIKACASDIFSSPITLSALGPLDNLESFEDTKARFTG